MSYTDYSNESTQTMFGAPGYQSEYTPSELNEKAGQPNGKQNVAMPERIVSGLAGTALTVWAVTQRRGIEGALLAATGGYLAFRGVTGHCPGYHALRTGTVRHSDKPGTAIPHGQGIKVEEAVAIMKPAEELYNFWRKFENLPHFMNHLESVTEYDEKRSHWKAKGPFGSSVEWDAEVINEIPGELIAWRSVDEAEVPNAGSVRFQSLPEGHGTKLTVTLEYNPPAGKLGAAIAALFGEEPHLQVKDDLRRFKSLMEAGVIPTVKGQPRGGEKVQQHDM
ncbi:MAG: SRPBCC family protein [Armatimonadaceae bacterium]